MFNRILVVCTGNICRSPMAEFLLRQRLDQVADLNVEVRSVGTGALVDHPAEETTSAMMQIKGLDLATHRARQLTTEFSYWAELILVMEKHHRDAVMEMDPTARGKTFLLGHWIDQEVPDPYRHGSEAHARSMKIIEAALDPWVKKLKVR